ncbi:hypothetical protein ACN082_09890 [Rothia sp. CCM 9417]|uniref:hypothetical protein n=1 Tax=unclassified Rothia (in: high G+C Gram-positive bacteria) TaxID=2689056 RepID=UPI003AC24824
MTALVTSKNETLPKARLDKEGLHLAGVTIPARYLTPNIRAKPTGPGGAIVELTVTLTVSEAEINVPNANLH